MDVVQYILLSFVFFVQVETARIMLLIFFFNYFIYGSSKWKHGDDDLSSVRP